MNKTEFKIEGEKLLAKVKELIHEGNIHRIIIKNEDGKTIIEIPMTVGVVGSLIAPVLAAVGAVAAFAAHYTIVVEKEDEDEQSEGKNNDEERNIPID